MFTMICTLTDIQNLTQVKFGLKFVVNSLLIENLHLLAKSTQMF